MEKKPFVTKEQLEEIAKTYPTPFYLYDEKGIRENALKLKEAFSWNKGFREYFAVKATPNPFILKILQELGCGTDCSSKTELLMSDACGFSGHDIMFSSNDTPPEEFKLAYDLGAIINLDDFTHIECLEKTIGTIPETICCRFNPGGLFKVTTDIMDNPGDAKYGMTEAQIFSLLEEKGVSTVEQLEEAAANYDFKFSFLKGVVPLGDPKRLEGYLFPDTYEFYMGEEPVSVLNKMILRFDEIFTDEMRQEVQNDGRTIQDVVTVASMIEKETDGSDQAKIASVIYNRLDNPTSETAGYLNIDATILYATGGTEVDLNADTPYNTRTHKGLTPTAIASPGVDALKAAVYPDSTRYYFYALGDDGKHHFFATYREQQNFIASQERYQNG